MANRPLLSPPRLRPSPWEELHTTWLELFYDLVVAVAVTQAAIPLWASSRAPLFPSFSACFCWSGGYGGPTVYTTRFETDDTLYVLLAFAQMLAVVGIAVAIPQVGLGNTRGFGIAYLASRLILLVLLARAWYYVVETRQLMRIYLTGFGVGAGIWAASLFFPPPAQFVLWGISLTIDLLTPWVVWGTVPPSSEVNPTHIPERLATFTIIVLGLSVAIVVRSLTNTPIALETAMGAVLGFLITACLWWTVLPTSRPCHRTYAPPFRPAVHLQPFSATHRHCDDRGRHRTRHHCQPASTPGTGHACAAVGWIWRVAVRRVPAASGIPISRRYAF